MNGLLRSVKRHAKTKHEATELALTLPLKIVDLISPQDSQRASAKIFYPKTSCAGCDGLDRFLQSQQVTCFTGRRQPDAI